MDPYTEVFKYIKIQEQGKKMDTSDLNGDQPSSPEMQTCVEDEINKISNDIKSADDIKRLLERTRQRREMLNQKLGRTPEAAPRKRTLEDNTTHNVESNRTVDDNSPGKRQCLREDELLMKPDTPAIISVKSRLTHLQSQRQDWSAADGVDVDGNAPVHSQRPTSQISSKENNETAEPISRRGRFAKLAQNINNWEDDLSHPTIQKPEEPKPRWQPPKKQEINENKPTEIHKPTETKKSASPIKAYNPEKSMAPPPPPAPPLPPTGFNSPKRANNTPPTKSSPVKAVSTHSIVLKQPQNQQIKHKHEIRHVIDQIPVNAKGLDESVMSDVSDEPTTKPILERMETWKQGTTPKKSNIDPSEAPLTSKLASWEQKISNTPTAVSKVPMPTKQTATPVVDKPPLPKPVSTTKPKLQSVSTAPVSNPAQTKGTETSMDPISQPVASRMASWQQKVADAEPKREEEPTAYSILARMSAWEDMSSSNKVSYIKKIDPGASPNASPCKPVQKSSAMPNKPATPSKTGPVKTGGSSPAKNVPLFNTPGKLQTAASPKVGSATKKMQEKLIEQTQHGKTDEVAERMRKERMAELDTLQNRWHNGVLKEDQKSPSHPQVSKQTIIEQQTQEQKPVPQTKTSTSTDQHKDFKARARADFESKLVAMGFELSDGCASYNFKNGNQDSTQKTANQLPPRPPPPPNQNGKIRIQSDPKPHQSPVKQNSQNPEVKSAPKPTSSIYRLISQKRGENDRPQVSSNKTLTRNESKKRVQFQQDKNDSFDSTEDEELRPRYQSVSTTEDESDNKDDTEPPSDEVETQDSSESEYRDNSYEDTDMTEEDIPQNCGNQNKQIPQPVFDDDSDDMTFSAFVPPSVRRQSVLPNPPSPQRQHPDDNLSLSSQDSYEDQPRQRHPVASVPSDYRHRSTTNLVSLGQQQHTIQESTSSLTSECSATSSQSSLNEPPVRYRRQDSEISDEDREEMDDFLEEALSDDDDDVRHRSNIASKQPAPIPRKRRSHMIATADDNSLAYSVSMYRSNGPNDKVAPLPKTKIVRNREFSQDIEEEDIEMPTHLPPEVERKSIKERIQELQELVTQEQNVIMQTSNALNQCCSENSHFAGSAEQVECNRLLLLSCQKRMAYLTEVQRLKDTGQLDPPGSGPKGSVTISDIRLPLKKEFVTKIGTSTDNITHYFLILIRNNAQVIVTQMLSTHDPMMRGSLDFPNLIKIHGISSSFKLNLEIYSMSVSRESYGKDKKRKTPKKGPKGQLVPVESPGGPSAVRTTSFTHITTLPLTMRSLDKNCFTLERIPYLSPLHGTIYLRLKCLMEQNVEERGFLTMFEDVSGFGAWHRRWVVLAGNKLCYWKYPDDEKRKEPMGFMDLKRCITEKVGLIPRDICARPNTFELVTVRQPIRGEQDTLVTKTYNTMTTTRHNLSADTKEERINWCNRINRALANIRTWHSDAMRPVKVQQKQT